MGLDGLHRVHRKVEPRPRKTVLPPDLFKRYDNLAFWQNMPGSAAYKIVVQTGEEEQPEQTMPEPVQKIEAEAGGGAFTVNRPE